MGWLSSIFGAIGAVFGWISKRQDLENTKPMQDEVLAQRDADLNNQISNEVKNKDEAAIRNRISS